MRLDHRLEQLLLISTIKIRAFYTDRVKELNLELIERQFHRHRNLVFVELCIEVLLE